MKNIVAKWKNSVRDFYFASHPDDVEVINRIVKGRTEANRFLVGIATFFSLVDTALIFLSLLNVLKIHSVFWTVLLLGGGFLLHIIMIILGFSLKFEGKKTQFILFALTYVSLMLISVWMGKYIALIFAIPLILSVRYYNVYFSVFATGFSLFFYALSSFFNTLVWQDIGNLSFATKGEMLAYCFNADFVALELIMAMCGIISVCSTVGGRKMILEEAEIMSLSAKNELEIAEARTQIMISQIQPHFIYNTLNSICYLCGKDAEAAQNAISDFADYLRENLNFSSKGEMIPFERELEHIKKYLSLEKMRFEDELNVVYDIECSSFSVPSLSVQPMVENAVKHGVCRRNGGGTVTLSAKDALTSYQIVISDDGVGFDTENPYPSDNRVHIGLENTRTRLAKMCNATLDIKSKIGYGTTVTINIPKEYYYENSRT